MTLNAICIVGINSSAKEKQRKRGRRLLNEKIKKGRNLAKIFCNSKS